MKKHSPFFRDVAFYAIIGYAMSYVWRFDWRQGVNAGWVITALGAGILICVLLAARNYARREYGD